MGFSNYLQFFLSFIFCIETLVTLHSPRKRQKIIFCVTNNLSLYYLATPGFNKIYLMNRRVLPHYMSEETSIAHGMVVLT